MLQQNQIILTNNNIGEKTFIKFLQVNLKEPYSEVWKDSLIAYKSHCNIELAEHMLKNLLALDPEMLEFIFCLQTSLLSLESGRM
jgi:hypothetical protein